MKKLFFAAILFAHLTQAATTAAVEANTKELSLDDGRDYIFAFNVGSTRLATSENIQGLSFEGFYQWKPRLSFGGGFAHYDYNDGANSFQLASALAEYQPIQADLYGDTKLFSAIVLGIHRTLDREITNLTYGAGVGVKFNDQIGVRFDIRSGREITTANVLSLVGYY